MDITCYHYLINYNFLRFFYTFISIYMLMIKIILNANKKSLLNVLKNLT